MENFMKRGEEKKTSTFLNKNQKDGRRRKKSTGGEVKDCRDAWTETWTAPPFTERLLHRNRSQKKKHAICG